MAPFAPPGYAYGSVILITLMMPVSCNLTRFFCVDTYAWLLQYNKLNIKRVMKSFFQSRFSHADLRTEESFCDRTPSSKRHHFWQF